MKLSERIPVIDLEATCWEYGKMPAGSIMEILGIGICTLIKSTGQITDNKVFMLFQKDPKSQIFVFLLQELPQNLFRKKELVSKRLARKLQMNISLMISFGEVMANLTENYFKNNALSVKFLIP